jgi:hypothetical protein
MVAGAVSGATFAAVVLLALGERPEAAAPATLVDAQSQREHSELKAAIDGLRADVERWQVERSPQGKAEPEAARSDPLGPAAPATQADLAAMAESLRILAESVEANITPTMPLAPDAEKHKALESDLARSDGKERWLRWTETQMLNAYGRPDAFGGGQNLTTYKWVYFLSEPKAMIVTFIFTGGRVIDMQVERP